MAISDNMIERPLNRRDRPPIKEAGPSVDTTENTQSEQNSEHRHSKKGLGAIMKSLFRGDIRKLLLTACGMPGTSAIWLGSLWTALAITGYAGEHLYEILGLTLAYRLLYGLTRGKKPILNEYSVRKNARALLSEELLMTAIFISACYMLNWQIQRVGVMAFIATNLILQLALMFMTRLALKIAIRVSRERGYSNLEQQVIIVGTGVKARQVADRFMETPESETSVLGFLDYHKKSLWRYRDIPLIGHPNQLEKIAAAAHIDAVIIAVEPEDIPHSRPAFATAEKMGIPIFLIPDLYEPTISRATSVEIAGMSAVAYHAVPNDRLKLLTKTIIDKLGAFAGLVFLSPLLALTALAIKFESKGPVFFKQKRMGLNGKNFSLYKFRTMCNDAERQKDQLTDLNEMSGPMFKIKRDPRVTRVGQVLRKYSIDEIPQFLNVLNGDMSLVGPRPPLPHEVAKFQPWQRRKLSVKPGVTCLWQVGGRNNIDFDDWMKLDLEYIDNWSLWLDTKLIIKTVPAVINGNGAS